MAKFYPLEVNDIKRETEDAVSVAFKLENGLKDKFSFKQGQYLTFKMKVNGEELRRSYSICTSPVADNELRIAAKKVEGGRVSNFLNNDLKVGDSIEVMPPMGNFYSEVEASNQKSYLLFAGGSGITPILSIIKTVLSVETKSELLLFYANKSKASTIFKNEIETLAANSNGRFEVKYVLEEGADESLFEGVMTEEKVEAITQSFPRVKQADEYFICGPAKMMDNIEAVLSNNKIDKKKIYIEHFTAVLKAIEATETDEVLEDVESEITVIMDDEEFEFSLKTSGEALLDASIAAGADAPFSCKGAVCCTCKAKVLEGKVKMDKNYALSEEEVEEGFVLACQAHPITPKVTLSFDEA